MGDIVKGDGWELRGGKWQDSAPEMVDHVISDPPFSNYVSKHAKPRVALAYRSKAERKRQERLHGAVKDSHGCASLSFDGVVPLEVGPALVALSRRWTVLFCAVEQIGEYKAASPKEYIRGGWWAKTNAAPQFTGDRPASPGEGIVILHQVGKKRWSRGGHKAEWRGPSSHSTGAGPFDERIHETQKPLWLMQALIEAFTDPGELIWDPYCGSGTTGVACLLTGRRFLGHELQTGPPEYKFDYVADACERLRAAERGQAFGEYRAGQETLFGRAKCP